MDQRKQQEEVYHVQQVIHQKEHHQQEVRQQQELTHQITLDQKQLVKAVIQIPTHKKAQQRLTILERIRVVVQAIVEKQHQLQLIEHQEVQIPVHQKRVQPVEVQ